MIKIIRNAPPPPGRRQRVKAQPPATYTRYPWKELEVGDAFDILISPSSPPPDGRWPEQNRVSATISKRHKSHPERYMARMMDDFRVRVWRIR